MTASDRNDTPRKSAAAPGVRSPAHTVVSTERPPPPAEGAPATERRESDPPRPARPPRGGTEFIAAPPRPPRSATEFVGTGPRPPRVATEFVGTGPRPPRGATEIVDAPPRPPRGATEFVDTQAERAPRGATELYAPEDDPEVADAIEPEPEPDPEPKPKPKWAKPEPPPPASPVLPAARSRAARRQQRLRVSEDPPAALPCVGDMIEGRYRIVRPIGVGGMGHVFLVDHVRLQKQLALKVLSPQVLVENGEGQKARFLNEARAASRLQHPAIVEVTDFGETKSGLPFIVMEYLQGEELADRLFRGETMTWPEVRDVIVQVLDALAVAHAHGVVHRDIKPENCFISVAPDTGARTLKLLDFGIAKVLTETDGAVVVTQRGELLGTPQYMSPEQAIGKPVDNRSDIYAVGILLYELLAGTPPFDEGTPMEVLTKQITAPPPPLLERLAPEAGVPAAVHQIVSRALAKDPQDRFATVEAMAQALHDAEQEPPPPPSAESSSTAATPDAAQWASGTHSDLLPSPAASRTGLWITLAVTLAAVLAAAAWWLRAGAGAL